MRRVSSSLQYRLIEASREGNLALLQQLLSTYPYAMSCFENNDKQNRPMVCILVSWMGALDTWTDQSVSDVWQSMESTNQLRVDCRSDTTYKLVHPRCLTATVRNFLRLAAKHSKSQRELRVLLTPLLRWKNDEEVDTEALRDKLTYGCSAGGLCPLINAKARRRIDEIVAMMARFVDRHFSASRNHQAASGKSSTDSSNNSTNSSNNNNTGSNSNRKYLPASTATGGKIPMAPKKKKTHLLFPSKKRRSYPPRRIVR